MEKFTNVFFCDCSEGYSDTHNPMVSSYQCAKRWMVTALWGHYEKPGGAWQHLPIIISSRWPGNPEWIF